MHASDKSVIIENKSGTMKMRVIPTGACVTDLWLTDGNGKKRNVVVSYEDEERYKTNPYYLGAAVGRSAGRQKDGIITMPDGSVIKVPANEGTHHLHGGEAGLSRQEWTLHQSAPDKVVCTILSPDGDGGYPGDVRVSVTYEVTDENRWIISYSAESSADTPLNLTQHTYFNLSGTTQPVTDHSLSIDADRVLFLDEEDIPERIVQVGDEPDFDFRARRNLSFLPEATHSQMTQVGGGVDHPFLLNKAVTPEIVLESPDLRLEVTTDDEAVVIYTGNKFDGEEYRKYQGICIETQYRPNALGDTVLRKGDIYQKETVFQFKNG